MPQDFSLSNQQGDGAFDAPDAAGAVCTTSPRRSGGALDCKDTVAQEHGDGASQAAHPSQTSAVSKMTHELLATYQRCGGGVGPTQASDATQALQQLQQANQAPEQGQQAQRNLLTKPFKGLHNDGHDNENWDLIICVGDEFVSSSNLKYVVIDLLGQGTFGQVVRCWCDQTQEHVAVKVIKNQPAYYQQARVEVGLLQYLNRCADADDVRHIVRLRDYFLFRNHLCLAFELLSVNLYELIKHNQFRGLSAGLVRVFIAQLLDALVVLRESRLIHCDLKPENVLLTGAESADIKVIDFGSACLESKTVYSYIQSRFYRSPEVVLGYPYNVAIDMWSLGCMAAELFLGLPLFPGASEHDLLSRVVQAVGLPPLYLLQGAKHTNKYFKMVERVVLLPGGRSEMVPEYVLRTAAEFEALTGLKATTGKRYFSHTRLQDIVNSYPSEGAGSELRRSLLDFLRGVLDPDPAARWTPQQAARHPFVTGQPFVAPFQPDGDRTPPPPGWDAAAAGMLSGSVGHQAAQQQQAGWNGAAASPHYGSAAAAMLATSPHVQAHAAAMAALAQQQQQSMGTPSGLPSYRPQPMPVPRAGPSGGGGGWAAPYSHHHQQQQQAGSLTQQFLQQQQQAGGSLGLFSPPGLGPASLMQLDHLSAASGSFFSPPGSLVNATGRLAPAPGAARYGSYHGGSYQPMPVDVGFSPAGSLSANSVLAVAIAAANAAAASAAAQQQQHGVAEQLRLQWQGAAGGGGVPGGLARMSGVAGGSFSGQSAVPMVGSYASSLPGVSAAAAGPGMGSNPLAMLAAQQAAEGTLASSLRYGSLGAGAGGGYGASFGVSAAAATTSAAVGAAAQQPPPVDMSAAAGSLGAVLQQLQATQAAAQAQQFVAAVAAAGASSGSRGRTPPPPDGALAAMGATALGATARDGGGSAQQQQRHESVSPSPGDWDPLYSDDQLLEDDTPSQQRTPPQQTQQHQGSSSLAAALAAAVALPAQQQQQQWQQQALAGGLSPPDPALTAAAAAALGALQQQQQQVLANGGASTLDTADLAGWLQQQQLLRTLRPPAVPAGARVAGGAATTAASVEPAGVGGAAKAAPLATSDQHRAAGPMPPPPAADQRHTPAGSSGGAAADAGATATESGGGGPGGGVGGASRRGSFEIGFEVAPVVSTGLQQALGARTDAASAHAGVGFSWLSAQLHSSKQHKQQQPEAAEGSSK